MLYGIKELSDRPCTRCGTYCDAQYELCEECEYQAERSSAHSRAVKDADPEMFERTVFVLVVAARMQARRVIETVGTEAA